MAELTAQIVRAVLDASSVASLPHAVAVRAAGGVGVDVCKGRLGTVDLSTGTTMYAASIAKQVIGVLAAQQARGGLIDPNEVLGRYIEGLPEWARSVRLRHLIHHTSGLVDDLLDRDLRGNADVVSRLRAHKGPLAEPGFTYQYSNLGYICLAEVLSHAGGRRVELQAHRLFKQLGMTSARLGGPLTTDLQGQQSPPSTVGDGGLWLSAGDLRRWNDAMNGRVLGSAVHVLAERPGQLDDGTPIDYAWGVRVFEHAGHRTVSHGDSWPTWSAKTIRQPDIGISVAILTTSEERPE